MKYSYDFIHTFMNSTDFRPNSTEMWIRYDVPPATYYRWLRKYRDGVGADGETVSQYRKRIKEEYNARLAKEVAKVRADANAHMIAYKEAYDDHVNTLMMIHSPNEDVYWLLENTKAKVAIEAL